MIGVYSVARTGTALEPTSFETFDDTRHIKMIHKMEIQIVTTLTYLSIPL